MIGLETRDEMGVASEKQLIVELMGRNSNIILVDAEGRITDCLRRADFGEDAHRRLLPGMIYRFPPKQEKQKSLKPTQPFAGRLLGACRRISLRDKG